MPTAFAENKVRSVANDFVVAYDNPTNVTYSTGTVELFHDGVFGVDADATVYLYNADSGTPVDLDKFDFVIIPAGGSYSKECSLIGPGKKIVVRSSNANINAHVTALQAVPAAT